MKKMLALLLLVVCGGCANGLLSPENAHATLRTDRSEYDAGEAATLELANTSDGSVGYNLCFSQLERFSSTGWTLAEGTGTACLAILLLLESGERATYQLPLPEALRAGRYRVSTHIEASDGDSERVSTQPFTVR
ncbi:MAG TPA: immunoglobulin-like domain-containing protein [Longimicrobium sp.]|jgi:methionine-rich copper-binding protein CopC|uniref:immunoglobulin-like domain-containing protein n=1 Tax=Longimicrobium sp. TaxID=2029185 RepID=UPI002ED86A0B